MKKQFRYLYLALICLVFHTTAYANSWDNLDQYWTNASPSQMHYPLSLSSILDPNGTIYAAYSNDSTGDFYVWRKFPGDKTEFNQLDLANLGSLVHNITNAKLTYNPQNKNIYIAVANNSTITIAILTENPISWNRLTEINEPNANINNLAFASDNSGNLFLAYTYGSNLGSSNLKVYQYAENTLTDITSKLSPTPVVAIDGINLVRPTNPIDGLDDIYLSYVENQSDSGILAVKGYKVGLGVWDTFLDHTTKFKNFGVGPVGNGGELYEYHQGTEDANSQIYNQHSLAIAPDGKIYATFVSDNQLTGRMFTPQVYFIIRDPKSGSWSHLTGEEGLKGLVPTIALSSPKADQPNYYKLYFIYSDADGLHRLWGQRHYIEFHHAHLFTWDSQSKAWDTSNSEIQDTNGSNYIQMLGFFNNSLITCFAENAYPGDISDPTNHIRVFRYTEK